MLVSTGHGRAPGIDGQRDQIVMGTNNGLLPGFEAVTTDAGSSWGPTPDRLHWKQP
jgi:hypothetical protein